MPSQQTTLLSIGVIGNLIGDRRNGRNLLGQAYQNGSNTRKERKKPYRTDEAATLAAGIELWQSKTPALALVDVELPDGKGLAFVEWLREQIPNPIDPLPVIVVGPQDDAKTAVQVLKLGAMDYLIKDDLSTTTLINSIHQALSRLQGQSNGKVPPPQNGMVPGPGDRQENQTHLDLEPQALGTDQRFRDIFHNLFQFVGLLTPTGIVLEANQVALDVGGIGPQDVLGKPFWECYWWTISSATQTQLKQAIAKAAQGEFVRYEVEVWGRNQTIIPIDFSLRPVRNEQGDIIYLIPEGRDLRETKEMESERRKALQLLQDSEQRYATLTSAAPVGIFRTDAQGKCIFFNEAYSRITTLTPARKAQGIQWIDFLHPGDRDRVLTTWVEKSANREICCQEFRLCHPDGSLIWVYCQVVPEFDSLGNPMGYVGTMTDVTPQKEAETKLKTSEAALAEAQRIAHIGNWSFDLRTGKITWSEELFRMFGLDPQQPEPSYEEYLQLLHPEGRQQLIDSVNETLAIGKPYCFDYCALHPNGERRYHESRGEAVLNADGEIVALQGTCMDITDRKLAEIALAEKENQSRALLDAIPDYLFRVDEQGIYQEIINDCSKLSLIPEDVDPVGLAMVDVLPPTISQRQMEYLHDALRTGELQVHEQAIEVGGKIRHEEVRVIRCGNNEALFMIRDITDRKQAEAKLRQSEAFLEEAQRLAHIGSWSFDLNTQKITWSDELFRMFGRDPQDSEPPYADYLNTYLHPDDRPILEHHVAIAIAEGTPYIIDYRAMLPDGTIRYHEARGQLERDSAGKPKRLFGTAMDITERKTYEQQLQNLNQTLEARIQERTQELENSQQFIKTILDTIPLPVFWKDRNSRLMGCNQKLADAMGLKSSDDLHSQQGSEFSPAPEEIEKYINDDQLIMASGRPLLGIEETFTDTEGNQKIIETNKAPLRDNQGNVIGIVGMFQDVTQRRQTERENRDLKERLEFLLSTSPAIIYSARPDGNYATTFISENVETVLGYQPEDFLAKDNFWPGQIHPEDQERILQHFADLSRYPIQKHEYRFKHKQGHYVWLRDELRLVWDDKGDPLEIVGYIADVSDLRQAETALKESELRWQFALEGAGDGVWDWNVQDNSVYYSSQWKAMLGYEDHEIQNQFSEWEKLVHGDDKEQALQDIEDYLTGINPTYQNEHRLRHKDGSYKWILTRGKIVARADNGEPLRLIGTHTDITAQKQAEKTLRKSQLHLQTAQRISQIGSWEFDVMSGKITWSEEVFHIFGLPKEAGAPSLEGLLAMVHPEDRDRHSQVVAIAIEQGQSYTIDYRIERSDGTLAYLLARGEVYCNAQGRVTQLIGTVQDLTEQKLAEKQLREAKESAELANRAKSEFLALMSHEIRTPMNGILGLTHLALQTQPNATLDDYLQKINQSGQSLLKIINNILDLSKIEAEKLELELSPFQFSTVLANVNNILSPKADEKDVALTFFLDPELPDYLLGDELRLGQIVINLASNALKFTDQGTVAIAVNGLDRRPASHVIQIIVEDTGIGIDPSQHHSLFEAFSQADASISRKYSGTGLGLSICKRLVDLMGGQIEVFSALGQGSRFVVTLDLPLPPAAGSTVITANSLAPLAGLKCLVAEDMDLTRETLASFLTAMGLRVTAVSTAETAIALLQECPMADPFELVILDWHMPGLNGIEASYQLKDAAGLTIIPKVLLMTAHPRHEIEPIVDDNYVSGILIKPFSVDQLTTAIANVFASEQPLSPSRLPAIPDPQRLQCLTGARILVVEDNDINQQVAAELLQSINLIVDIAPQGYAALEKIAAQHYDLILMDIRMPGMDGYETTRRIRALAGQQMEDRERFMTVPIVAMTAHAMPSDRLKSLQAGMNDHVSKPIDPQALFLTLLKWIPPQSRSNAPDLCATCGANGSAIAPSLMVVPRIAGVNVPRGIARLAGNQAAYFRLLKRFYNTYHGFPDRLQSLFEAGQFNELFDAIHALKGVSGNLGAEELHQALSAFTQSLKHPERSPHLSPCFDRVQQTLTALLRDLAASSLLATQDQSMTGNGKTSSTTEKVPLQLLLKRFSASLDNDLGAAIAVFEQLKQLETRPELKPILVAMETELDNFNLDSVHQHLHTLTAYLDYFDLPSPNGHCLSGRQA